MTDYSNFPGLGDGNKYPYFPPIVGDGEQVRCWECEYHKNSVCERCENPEHCDWCECATDGKRTVAPCKYGLFGQFCPAYGKFQRGNRAFSVTSGRCPRMPDRRGFVHPDEWELYASIFPLIHAKRGEESLDLSLSIPGQKRLKKVYRSNGYGVCWFREGRRKRILELERSFRTKQEILDYMELRNWDYCIFRTEITERYL